MAKIPFSKLKCKINEEIKTISFNDETIEVKQYLPIQDKLTLVGRVVEFAHDQDHNYSNPIKADVFRDLEIIFNYTNISFTDKQKEDIPKLYDQLLSSGLMTIVMATVPETELQGIRLGVAASITSIYQYQNSILGILDTIGNDYSSLSLDAGEIQKKIADPNNLELLKNILTKLG